MPASDSQTTTKSTLPSIIPDLPASSVIMVIYFCLGLGMIVRFRQLHLKFRVQIMLISLCMSRTVAFALRSAWAVHPLNTNLAIAATVLVNAGVILLVAANMQLLIRLVKSRRPELQKSTVFVRGTTAVQLFIIVILIMTIVPVILNIITTNLAIKQRTGIVIKISSTYLATYASLPFVLVPIIVALVKRSPKSIVICEHYKAGQIMWTSALVGVELNLRCASNYGVASLTRWYSTRASFYVSTPMLELLCILPLFLINLPHAFGDSNVSVLSMLNKDDSDDKYDEELHNALRQTTTTWREGIWQEVRPHGDIDEKSTPCQSPVGSP